MNVCKKVAARVQFSNLLGVKELVREDDAGGGRDEKGGGWEASGWNAGQVGKKWDDAVLQGLWLELGLRVDKQRPREKQFSFCKSRDIGETPITSPRIRRPAAGQVFCHFEVGTSPMPALCGGAPAELRGRVGLAAAGRCPGSAEAEAGSRVGERAGRGWALTAERPGDAGPGSSQVKGCGHKRGHHAQELGLPARGVRGRPWCLGPRCAGSRPGQGAGTAISSRAAAGQTLRRGRRPASPMGAGTGPDPGAPSPPRGD